MKGSSNKTVLQNASLIRAWRKVAFVWGLALSASEPTQHRALHCDSVSSCQEEKKKVGKKLKDTAGIQSP